MHKTCLNHNVGRHRACGPRSAAPSRASAGARFGGAAAAAVGRCNGLPSCSGITSSSNSITAISSSSTNSSTTSSQPRAAAGFAAGLLAAALILGGPPSVGPAWAAAISLEEEEETLSNVPGQLGSAAEDTEERPLLSKMMTGRNGRAIEGCTRKCLPSCTRGGSGAPGLGPLSLRREPGGVVFSEGFRSRSYCLRECAETCSALTNKAAANERR